ncbi:hypothetical protein [Paenibacillus sp. GCM10027626]|uniref:hypothetical protein n=1 Tax=Paenibacillus sp. GCM10027626 TaxID=3273411 RepID=UPI0036415A6E
MIQHHGDIQDLLEASAQIIDHMHESGVEKEQAERLQQLLHAQMNLLSSGATKEEFAHQLSELIDAADHSKVLFRADERLPEPSSIEAKSHDEIDQLSIAKVNSNLEKIRSMLM